MSNQTPTVPLLENGLLDLGVTPAHLVAIAAKNAKTPLLSLPPEIKKIIFDYVTYGNRLVFRWDFTYSRARSWTSTLR